jgi:hypothetical protein
MQSLECSGLHKGSGKQNIFLKPCFAGFSPKVGIEDGNGYEEKINQNIQNNPLS